MYRFIHNPHQKESREMLQELLNDPEISPQLEVIDFMEARKMYSFRATPTLWKIENNKITAEVDDKSAVKDIKKATKISKDIEPSEEAKKKLDEIEENITILSCLAKLLPADDVDREYFEKLIKRKRAD